MDREMGFNPMIDPDFGGKPSPEEGAHSMDLGGEDDDAIVSRIRRLVDDYRGLQNLPDPEKSDFRPDYHHKPGAEKIEEILRLMSQMRKQLEGQESLLLALKEGDVSPLDRLINPAKPAAPTEL